MRAAQLKYDKEVAEKQTAKKASDDKAQQWTNQIDAFNDLLGKSSDLSDQLQNLNDHLKEGTKATAVYIGKMVLPKNKIGETDNDTAHINNDATPQIQFCYADPEHAFLVDKVLAPGTGVTYDLFTDKPVEEEEAKEPELDEEGNPIPVKEKEPEEVFPRYMIVPEVVRDKQIYFFKVPKLGSYMAIRLEYETCLFEASLDAGIADQLAVNEKLRLQGQEKIEFERQQAEL